MMGKSREQDLKAAAHIASAIKNREQPILAACQLPFSIHTDQEPSQGRVVTGMLVFPTAVHVSKLILHRRARGSSPGDARFCQVDN